jgi:hypothetical protein
MSVKKLAVISVLILDFLTKAAAQSPNRMSYQSVVRNSSGMLVTNSPIGVKLSLLQSSITGSVVYTETHSVTSDSNGVVSLEIGGGTPVTGSISSINWASGLYFLKTEIDPAGGTNYTITGTSQLLSVPYALYSNNGLQSGSAPGNTPFWNGSNWVFNSSNIFNNGGNIGIGTSTPTAKLDIAGTLRTTGANIGSAGDPSAILHVQDIAKGVLLSRMTATQRIAINNPAEGLLVYQTDSEKGFWYFTGGQWKFMATSSSGNNGGKHRVYLSDGITNSEALAKIAAEVGSNTQEVRIVRCTNLTSIDLSMISNLTEIYISDNKVLQSINLDNLQFVDGGIFIDQCPALTSMPLPNLQSIGQTLNGTYGLQITNSGLTSLNLPAITQIIGGIYVYNNSALTSINFPQLTEHLTTGAFAFNISTNTDLTSVSFPLLNRLGDFSMFNNDNVSSVNLSNLTTANSFGITSASLTSLIFPALKTTTGLLQFEGTSLSSLSLPVLQTASGISIGPTALSSFSLPTLTTAESFGFYYSPSVSTISFPSLTTLNKGSIISCVNLISIVVDNLVNSSRGFSVTGCKLPSSQVNYLLNKLVSVTPILEFETFDFRQSVPAPPSGQGIIDKATLIARPNTVNTD